MRILCCVKGTISYGVFFQRKFHVNLVGFVDFDWTRELNKRRPTTNMLFQVGCSLINWSSKLQPIIALFTTEVEYHSLANAAKEITWLKPLLIKLHYFKKGSTKLFCDNLSNIKLVINLYIM